MTVYKDEALMHDLETAKVAPAAESPQFAPGDVVYLKSGSPKYTVVAANESRVTLMWSNYDTRKIETADVPPVVLRKQT